MRKSGPASVAAVALVLGVFFTGSCSAATIHELGGGTSSCGQYLKDRRDRDSVEATADMFWIQGFITAYNHYAAPDGNITAGIDSEGIAAWVDNYCQAHPLDDLAVAAAALVAELRARKH